MHISLHSINNQIINLNDRQNDNNEINHTVENKQGSLKDLENLRSKHLTNPIIGYLNINSLRGD